MDDWRSKLTLGPEQGCYPNNYDNKFIWMDGRLGKTDVASRNGIQENCVRCDYVDVVNLK